MQAGIHLKGALRFCLCRDGEYHSVLVVMIWNVLMVFGCSTADEALATAPVVSQCYQGGVPASS